MSIILDPHQEEAVEFILKHKKAALFMGCGTGKTYTSLEIFRRVEPKTCLIITTAKLINEKQWHEEIVEYLGYMPDNMELISHQKLSRRYKEYVKRKYDMIVIDEAHKIKSKAKKHGGTKISRLVRILSQRAEYSIPMTGTPIGKGFIDVFHIFRNCDIDMWHGWTEFEFIKAYYYYFMKDWSGAGFKVPMAIELKPDMKEILWKLIRKKAFVVKTEDVIDLEKQKIKLFYIEGLDKTEMYKTIKKKIIRYKDYEDTLIALRRIMFERQAANGFIYEETFDKNPLQFNTHKIDEFARKLPYLLSKLNNKLVVTYWFKQDKLNIQNKLDELGISYTESKKVFEKSAQVFMLHFSNAEGLNLQLISYGMVLYSYESSYTMFSQISHRIYRRGQDEQCYYIVMISRGTIEEQMWDNIKKRKEKDDFVKNKLKLEE